jgi:hypothetical protein
MRGNLSIHALDSRIVRGGEPKLVTYDWAADSAADVVTHSASLAQSRLGLRRSRELAVRRKGENVAFEFISA